MIDLLNKVVKKIHPFGSNSIHLICVFVCDHNAPEMRKSSKLFLLCMQFVYVERTRDNHDTYD